MRIQLTVRSCHDSVPDHDVVVDCVPGSRARELAQALGTHALSVDGRRVPDTALVGMPPLLRGAVVTVEGPSVGILPASPWELWVVEGPDVGLTFPLPVGPASVGRSKRATVVLTDPRVSRRHVEVVAGPTTGVTVRDLGGPNGTRVCGVRVSQSPRPLAVGGVVEVGATRLQLRAASRAARLQPDGEGHLIVSGTHPEPTSPTLVLRFPDAPPAVARSPFPLVALAVPLVLAAVLAAVMHSPTMLLFGLTGPVLSIATWLGERRRRRQPTTAVGRGAAVEQATAALERAVLDERAALVRSHPPLAEVLAAAETRSGGLWRGEAAEVRLGIGTRRSAVSAEGAMAPASPWLEQAPVTVDLSAVGVLGVCGDLAWVRASAAAMVARLATTAPPGRLQLAVVVARGCDAENWDWVARLPHSRFVAAGHEARRSIEELLGEIGRREDADRVRAPPQRRVLVVVDGWPVAGLSAALDAVHRRGPAVGVVTVVLARSRLQLPRCRAVLELGGSAARLSIRGPSSDPDEEETWTLAPDLPPGRWVARVSRALAPLRDTSGTASGAPPELPLSVRLLDLVGEVDGATVGKGWRAQGSSTRAVLGVAASGPVAVDLAVDGPHALIAGTTGAGKSELLQTLVCSLALANRPDELTFLLVDYKGGAAFRGCARLPHVVGVVTDLDGHLTARALTSLTAELRRRERLLADAGAGSLEEYRTAPAADPGRPALPRLVIAIDEFRVLAEELPDFVHGLVRLAAVGRSLGIHLVLATQRPGGIVSADIRANVSLRIALRVRDRSDSVDVMDDPSAAAIDAHTPGRATLKGAATTLTRFQSARVTSGPRAAGRLTVTPVTPVGLLGVDAGEADPDRVDGGRSAATDRAQGTDLDRIVTAVCEARVALGISEPQSPWLQPLPDVLPVHALRGAVTRQAVPVGLEDVPNEQRQGLWTWSVGDGHLGIAGGGRSGRTSAVATIAMQLASALAPESVHLYAIGPPALAGLVVLPHTVVVADVDDAEEVHLVLERLARLPRPEGDGARPVLLVDGWERLTAHAHGAVAAQVRSVLEGSATSGLRAVVTGGRTLLAGQLVPVLAQRLVLALGDAVELAMAGIPARVVPARQPPGRAVDARTHHEVQIATISEDWKQENLRQAAGVLAARWATVAEDAGREGWPQPVRRLPAATRFRRGALRDARRDGLLPVGVRDGDLEIVGFLPRGGERRILVVGPSGSGRTTTLETLAGGVAESGCPVVLVGAHWAPPHPEVLVLTGHGDEDVDRLVAARRASPDLAVIVDDAERLAGQPIEGVLLEIARRVDEDGGLIGAATSALALDGRIGALGADLARAHTGVVLWPAPGSIALGPGSGGPLSPARILGRGVLVSPRGVERVQVATVSRPR